MKTTLNKLLVLVLLGYSVTALAQSAATGPNSVYIEQIGSSNTVTIEQVGGTNRVGGVTVTNPTSVDSAGVTTLDPAMPSAINYGTITGSDNQLTITQTGNNNSAQYDIKGNENVYTSIVTGNGNQTKLTIGDVNNATNNNNTVTETITGNNNLIIQDIVGNNINSTVVASGDNNQVTKELKSSNGSSNIEVTGNSNIFNAQQVDFAGADGHDLTQVIVGDFNSVTTQQQGSNDTTIDVRVAGSHNTITVRSSSNTIFAPATAIAR